MPSREELQEALEESDFEVTLEGEEDDEETAWIDLEVYESSLDGPIALSRITDADMLEEEAAEYVEVLTEQNPSEEAKFLLNVFENCSIGFSIELPEEVAEDDNALMLCMVLAQTLAEKCDGIYSVDNEGLFDETGELIFELAEED